MRFLPDLGTEVFALECPVKPQARFSLTTENTMPMKQRELRAHIAYSAENPV